MQGREDDDNISDETKVKALTAYLKDKEIYHEETRSLDVHYPDSRLRH